MKIPFLTFFPQNVTEKPETSKSGHFSQYFMKKCQFSHEPLGLDRGFGALCRFWSYRGVSGVSGVSFDHFQQKPLGLDRVFSKITVFD